MHPKIRIEVSFILSCFGSDIHKIVAEAAANIARHLDYHPQALSLASSTIRYKGTTVEEYSQMLDAKTPVSMLGSTIDQSPVTRTILRISAMLSTSIIPLALFTATSQLEQVPERFSSIFSDMKSKQRIPVCRFQN